MRFVGRALSGVFLLSLTVALLAWAGVTVQSAVEDRLNREERTRPARERVFAVNVTTAEVQTISPVLDAFGEIQSRLTLDVRASAGGQVIEIADGFADGARVEQGELLFRVDPAEAQSLLDRTLADISEAEAEERDAQRTLALARDELGAAEAQAELRRQALARQEDLRRRGVGTDAAVEAAALSLSAADQSVLSRRQSVAAAESRTDLAAARLARLGIDLSDAKRGLSDTEVRAEFSGILSETAIQRGGLVGANERVATLIDEDNLEVAFRISTSQYARLIGEDGRLGRAEVEVILDAFGINITGEGLIDRESAGVGEGQTGRLIFARLSSGQGFRPGDFVTVRVQEPPLERVVALPSTAVSAGGEVLAIGDEDRLEALSVAVLRRQGDDVLVRGRGLRGREIVMARTPLIGPGIKVRPLRQGDAEVPEEPELVELTDERRARIIAFVEGNQRMPDEVKTRILTQLREPKVPVQMVERIESRMGG